MNIHAILFDVYKTILDVKPGPAGADAEWSLLCGDFLPEERPPSFADFLARCRRAVERDHAAAKTAGIAFPEVLIEEIVQIAWPALSNLTPPQLSLFLVRQAGLERSTSISKEAAACLSIAHAQGIPLGLVSNAQSYTVTELANGLEIHGLSPLLFDEELTFFSYRHGFSKPDPHVFRLLTARLRLRGIRPDAILMVGDRVDNDIEPARSAGWRTWHLSPEGDGDSSGGWHLLENLIGRGFRGQTP